MASRSVQPSAAIIYGLADPFTGFLFYVGKTTAKNRKDRFYCHITSGRTGHLTHCARKIRSIQAAGGSPEMFVIEETGHDWVEAEQFWIAYFTFIGCNLTNHTVGGEGLSGMKHSPEAINKTRQANIGAKRSAVTIERLKASWTPERKLKHIEFCKTRIMPEHQRQLISRLHSGKIISPEQREQISAFFKGRPQTEEQKRKSGEGVRAAWTPQRRVEQAERMSARRRSQPLKTHCMHGHPLSGDNLYFKPKSGARECRACGRRRPASV